MMKIALVTLELHLPGCTSLKEKRRRLKPLLARLGREFNISVAEVDRQDAWQETVIACALVSSDHNHAQRSIQEIGQWIEKYWPDVSVIDETIEII